MADQLTDEDEILFRQVHPNFVQKGVPSSETFMPTNKDENKLSVDRSSLSSAAQSFALFTGRGCRSAAVYGLCVREFEESGLPCISDPIEATGDQPANIAHAYADYAQHVTSKQKTLAKRLKIKALARGQLHPPKTA